LYQNGTSALDRGDSQQAVVELERAAELVPEASEVQNHLGLAANAMRSLRFAARLLSTATTQRPWRTFVSQKRERVWSSRDR